MRLFIPILLIFTFIACKGNQSPEQKAVDDQTRLYESNPSDSTAQALVEAISKYVEVHGTKDSTAARYILKAAEVSKKHNQLGQALGYYKMYMVQFPERTDLADRLIEVISIMEQLQKPELNQVLYRSFAQRFKDDPRAAQYSNLIDRKEVTLDSLLKEIGTKMFNDSIYRLNENMAHLYVDATEAAVMVQPDLPDAPEYLHRAAETARTLRDIPKAITLYDWIIERYPTHPRGSTALFLKAFTFDNDLKDYENARKYYEEFLAQYPKSEFAESAQFLIDNLGKSDEELRQIIEKRKEENMK
ncbi:MAG: tetratricopeptide repeat protein [Saprospiraceae bacterium]